MVWGLYGDTGFSFDHSYLEPKPVLFPRCVVAGVCQDLDGLSLPESGQGDQSLGTSCLTVQGRVHTSCSEWGGGGCGDYISGKWGEVPVSPSSSCEAPTHHHQLSVGSAPREIIWGMYSLISQGWN